MATFTRTVPASSAKTADFRLYCRNRIEQRWEICWAMKQLLPSYQENPSKYQAAETEICLHNFLLDQSMSAESLDFRHL